MKHRLILHEAMLIILQVPHYDNQSLPFPLEPLSVMFHLKNRCQLMLESMLDVMPMKFQHDPVHIGHLSLLPPFHRLSLFVQEVIEIVVFLDLVSDEPLIEVLVLIRLHMIRSIRRLMDPPLLP
jgi:hypothetical protein